ncbi:glycosyltransferase family 8 protein [Laccaria bicolor S238N-H82]|uniref:Glycosyltransferase family 8 protein n=1 Tax=Laccaria bicolor (strain S238N-H82 / ATCC MYA-4686) TaxID=486041 RepID=B0DJR4_LACBS|nr:glycosyltransferase family 8 protein [Laccaria bicolor S238N-H82]EDR05163.1 glycosyltransferase family 8 protein [Laccaria bicolor S238N-H82]|eukprot:XP_001884128.1 glycosyltransferase family 8 protein [Laccaria bicolor S238N-H82]
MSFIIRTILERWTWTYEPLPQSITQNPTKNSTRKRLLALPAGLAVVGVVYLLWWITSAKAPYSPLDNYQNINANPILGARPVASPSSRNHTAVVSTLYTDSYAIGVAVLGHSVRSANMTSRLILPYLARRVSPHALCIVTAAGWEPQSIQFIPPPHHGKGVHQRFKDQYTKLNIWTFDQLGIEKLVYLDADTLVLKNFDELFEMPFNFAAVPDVYEPGDRRGFTISFNAGVLAIQPSSAVFKDMREKIETARFPPVEAEQSFLNHYYGAKGVRLPYAYNMNLAIKKRSLELWENLKEEGKIVHYTLFKPFKGLSRRVSTRVEEEEAIRDAATQDGGFFAEEFGWWKSAYERLMADKGEEIERCRPARGRSW